MLTDLSLPGIQRPSYRQLVHALGAIVKGSGALPSFVPDADVERQAVLYVSCLRGALSSLQSYQGATFQLSCYIGLRAKLASNPIANTLTFSGTISRLL